MMRRRIQPLLLLAILSACHAFVDVARPSSSRSGSSISQRLGSSSSSSSSVSSQGISADLISRLAEVALKLRLPEERGVKFHVQANPKELLSRGRVGPVTVRGRAWRSPRGLSCRLIEATVTECELDISRVIASRKLVLLTPALGEAMIAFNSVDFGNFLTHPLVKPPKLASSEHGAIQFLKEDVHIDVQRGVVIFHGQYAGGRWRFELSREGENNAVVTATLTEGSNQDIDVTAATMELNRAVTYFFSNLLVELDGTSLSYRDMNITPKGASPSLLLKLDIKVDKFPAQSADF